MQEEKKKPIKFTISITFETNVEDHTNTHTTFDASNENGECGLIPVSPPGGTIDNNYKPLHVPECGGWDTTPCEETETLKKPRAKRMRRTTTTTTTKTGRKHTAPTAGKSPVMLSKLRDEIRNGGSERQEGGTNM